MVCGDGPSYALRYVNCGYPEYRLPGTACKAAPFFTDQYPASLIAVLMVLLSASLSITNPVTLLWIVFCKDLTASCLSATAATPSLSCSAAVSRLLASSVKSGVFGKVYHTSKSPFSSSAFAALLRRLPAWA